MGRRTLLFVIAIALGCVGCSVALGIDGAYEDCICGDGVICSIEACDDGNTSDVDRCSSTCVVREVVEVAAGNHHTCARLNDGSVQCWGSNAEGQLGFAAPTSNWGDEAGEIPSKLGRVNLGEGRTAVKIAAGYDHTCAILDDGKVTCWGEKQYGRLGLEPDSTTVDLGLDTRAEAIGAGLRHTCALLNGGHVMCWGHNDRGQVGAGDPMAPSPVEPPRQVDLGPGETAKAIAVGGEHTCAWLNAGTVKCWGSNDWGQLGLGDKAGQPTPAGPLNLGAGKTAKTLVAGRNHTCAVLQNDDSLLCWGKGEFGRLGLGDEMDQLTPTGPVDLGTGKVAALALGEGHTCAMLSDGLVRCWGYNAYGQVGVADVTNRESPAAAVKLGEGKTAVSIAAGSYHTCAILNDGSLKCWGSNGSGQLGLGDDSDRGTKSGQMGDSLLPVYLFSDAW